MMTLSQYISKPSVQNVSDMLCSTKGFFGRVAGCEEIDRMSNGRPHL